MASYIIKYCELVKDENLTDLYILDKFLKEIMEEIDAIKPFIDEVKKDNTVEKFKEEIVYYNKLCWDYERGQNRLNKLTEKDCKCIRFINGNKFYNNGCKIHKNKNK